MRRLTTSIPGQLGLLGSKWLGITIEKIFYCLQLIIQPTVLFGWVIVYYGGQIKRIRVIETGLEKAIKKVKIKSFVNVSEVPFKTHTIVSVDHLNIYHLIRNLFKHILLYLRFLWIWMVVSTVSFKLVLKSERFFGICTNISTVLLNIYQDLSSFLKLISRSQGFSWICTPKLGLIAGNCQI